MTEHEDKLKEQLEIVLQGETNLLESAHVNHINIEQMEEQMKSLLSRGIIFGSGDVMMDVMACGYWLGRKHQFFASMAHMFGKDELERIYTQICIKMGISPKRLN